MQQVFAAEGAEHREHGGQPRATAEFQRLHGAARNVGRLGQARLIEASVDAQGADALANGLLPLRQAHSLGVNDWKSNHKPDYDT